MRWIRRAQFAIAAAALLSGAMLMGWASQQPQPAVPSGQSQSTFTPKLQLSPEATRLSQPEFLVMIDPSHGGDDKGAALGSNRWEKEVTLALARELRLQLEQRGISAQLLRDSDLNLTLERRAEATNQERASVYIALHAGPPGRGMRVYTPALENTQPPAVGKFVPWESAQAVSRARSVAVAAAVAAELRKTGLHVATFASSLRPLNNVVAPAIAVEWSPGPEELLPPDVQKLENTLTSLIASGIAQVRSPAGERP